MKLTSELLQQMIMEELRSLNEDDSIKLPGITKIRDKNVNQSVTGFANKYGLPDADGKNKEQIKAMSSFKALRSADTNKDNLLSKAEIEAAVKAGGEAAEVLKQIIASKPDLFKGVEWEWNKAAGDAKDPSTETDPADATKDPSVEADPTDATKDPSTETDPAAAPTWESVPDAEKTKIVDDLVKNSNDQSQLKANIATKAANYDNPDSVKTELLKLVHATFKGDPATGDIDLKPADITTVAVNRPDAVLVNLLNKALLGPLTTADLTNVAGIQESRIINEEPDKLELSDFVEFLNDYADDELPSTLQGVQKFRAMKKALTRVINLLTQAKNKGDIAGPMVDNMLSTAREIMSGDYDDDQLGFDPFKKDPSASEAPIITPIPIEMGMSGKMAPATALAFSEAFAGAKSIRDRLSRLAELSLITSASGTAPAGTIGENVSGLVILDCLARLARSIESGSAAGWMLEGFLGALFGGTDVGAAMGAADFSMKGIFASNGVKGGSAKFYASGDDGFGDQGATDFLNLTAGESIRYIFLEKAKAKAGADVLGKRWKRADLPAGDFISAQAYIVDVKRRSVSTASGTTAIRATIPSGRALSTKKTIMNRYKADFVYVVYKPDGGKVTLTLDYEVVDDNIPARKSKALYLKKAAKDGDPDIVRFKFNRTADWGAPFIISIPSRTNYQDQIKNGLGKIKASVKDMFESASKFRSFLDAYVMGGELEDGLNSVREYGNLKNKVNTAYGDLEAETGVRPQITENKNNLDNILDKLIKEVILNK